MNKNRNSLGLYDNPQNLSSEQQTVKIDKYLFLAKLNTGMIFSANLAEVVGLCDLATPDERSEILFGTGSFTLTAAEVTQLNLS